MSKLQTAKALWKKDKLSIILPIFIKLNKLGLLRWIPSALFLKIDFRLTQGFPLNLKEPHTFNEKIQWLKLYGYKPVYDNYVDKFAVKDYIREIIGDKYVIPTYGVWERVDDIEWDKLPQRFVLKTTTGSGGYDVCLCRDKSAFDIEAAKKKMANSLKNNTYWYGRERPYKNLKPRIMAEMLLESSDDDLPDFKFYCFNGEPEYCQVIRDRRTRETIDFYDMNWNHQEFYGLNPAARNGSSPVACPVKLDEMITICRMLSENIPFVRVDLYEVKGKCYFGELTFYPASGFGTFTPQDWNGRIGDLLRLPVETRANSCL